MFILPFFLKFELSEDLVVAKFSLLNMENYVILNLQDVHICFVHATTVVCR